MELSSRHSGKRQGAACGATLRDLRGILSDGSGLPSYCAPAAAPGFAPASGPCAWPSRRQLADRVPRPFVGAPGSPRLARRSRVAPPRVKAPHDLERNTDRRRPSPGSRPGCRRLRFRLDRLVGEKVFSHSGSPANPPLVSSPRQARHHAAGAGVRSGVGDHRVGSSLRRLSPLTPTLHTTPQRCGGAVAVEQSPHRGLERAVLWWSRSRAERHRIGWDDRCRRGLRARRNQDRQGRRADRSAARRMAWLRHLSR